MCNRLAREMLNGRARFCDRNPNPKRKRGASFPAPEGGIEGGVGSA